ncbi:MAG: DNA cytosine methyltransferase [bacterium]|nr:DNA cytosine methyltransferase [bacterium]
MNAGAYYNEHDKFAAAWLRNLIAAGHIAPGDVDERDIRDVRPVDLRGYTQCHFFAGIGVWSYALRRAGWPDRRPVWTWSEPCQPFSAAGRGLGAADERYLRPHMHHLVRACRPVSCFGEQVASKDGLAWLDTLQSDMEGEDYTFGAFDLCAAGFGAPHIRQRLYWLADAGHDDRAARAAWGQFKPETPVVKRPASFGFAGRLANDDEHGRQGRPFETVLGTRRGQEGNEAGRSGGSLAEQRVVVGNTNSTGSLAGREGRAALGYGRAADAASGFGLLDDAIGDGWGTRRYDDVRHDRLVAYSANGNSPTGPVNGVWRNADWLLCRDGKWRPVEAGTFPLAHGAPSRVGRLRAYGNAIVATQAEEFIGAWLDAENEHLRLTSGVFA